jgi:hypothetical protein
MEGCGFSPALLLLQLMHTFMVEKHTQRVPALDAAGLAACGSASVGPDTDSFLFRANESRFRSAQEALDAAVAYLARPSITHTLQLPRDSMQSHVSIIEQLCPALIVLMGADSLPLVQDAAATFMKTWHASGCRRIVITGGIGRATPDLIKSFKKRTSQSQAAANHTESHRTSLSFAHAHGGPQSLPCLEDYSTFSLSWPPAVVAQ